MKADVAEVVKSIRDGKCVEVADFLRGGVDPNERNHLGWTLLHIASLEGQCEIVELLLNKGALVNCCTIDMCTPLHRACSQGRTKTAEALIKKGAFINAQDKNGNTPLHEAAKALHTPLVKVLLEKKADKTRKNKKNQIFTDMVGQQMMSIIECADAESLVLWLDWGLSPSTFGNLNWSILHHASARGQINIASILLERGANVNALDSNKSTPLHAACFHGHKRIAELLIGKGANLDSRDQLGNTPLHSAVSGAHPDIINVLLESGCDTKIENSEGQIFTHLVNEFLVDAVENRKITHVHSLLKGKANPDSKDAAGCPVLCLATLKGDLLIVDALLNAGGDPNLATEDSKMTPLHYASLLGNLFILKALLDKGASVSCVNRVNSTPLHEAAREGSEDIVTVLLGRCSPMDRQDNDGNTPLHIAARWGQTKVVDLLIEKGADETIRNKDGHIHIDLALMRAVRTANNSDVLNALAWGGDPNTQDSKGWYLLHHAVYKGNLEVCKLLIESEAEVNVADKEGRTPLLLAAYRGNHEIMQEIISAGADLNYQDRRQQTPLHWAAAEGSIATVELLLQRGAARNIRNSEGLLYTDLLLKHLYFAVRHNDVDKVECLLKAGADYTAEVNGTGTTPRDEAKRRKHYKILKKMLSLYPREKVHNNREDYIAIEDVCRLFEDQRRTPTLFDEETELIDDLEDEYDPDEDAYWRMHNSTFILSEKELIDEEASAFWEYWEEKTEKISFKEWCQEDLEDFWDYWEEKPQVISAREFFRDELPWWQQETTSASTSSTSISTLSSTNSGDDLYMVSFEDIKKRWGTVISAKELFKPEESWWRDAVEEIESSSDERDTSPLPFLTLNEVREKWGGEIISAKEMFKEEECWWRDAVEELSSSSEDSNPVPSMSDIMSKWRDVVPAKEMFRDDEYWINLFEADKTPKVRIPRKRFWWDNPRQEDEVIIKHGLRKPHSELYYSDDSESDSCTSEDVYEQKAEEFIEEIIEVASKHTEDINQHYVAPTIEDNTSDSSSDPSSEESNEITNEMISEDTSSTASFEDKSGNSLSDFSEISNEQVTEIHYAASRNSSVEESIILSDESAEKAGIEAVTSATSTSLEETTIDEWDEATENLPTTSSIMYSALEGDQESSSGEDLREDHISSSSEELERSEQSETSKSSSGEFQASTSCSDYEEFTDYEASTEASSYVTTSESDDFRSSREAFESTSSEESEEPKTEVHIKPEATKEIEYSGDSGTTIGYESDGYGETEESSSTSSEEDFDGKDDEEGMFYKIEYQNPAPYNNPEPKNDQQVPAPIFINNDGYYTNPPLMAHPQFIGENAYIYTDEPITVYYFQDPNQVLMEQSNLENPNPPTEELESSYTLYRSKEMILKSESVPTDVDYYQNEDIHQASQQNTSLEQRENSSNAPQDAVHPEIPSPHSMISEVPEQNRHYMVVPPNCYSHEGPESYIPSNEPLMSYDLRNSPYFEGQQIYEPHWNYQMGQNMQPAPNWQQNPEVPRYEPQSRVMHIPIQDARGYFPFENTPTQNVRESQLPNEGVPQACFPENRGHEQFSSVQTHSNFTVEHQSSHLQHTPTPFQTSQVHSNPYPQNEPEPKVMK